MSTATVARPSQADQLLSLLRYRGEAGVTPIDALREIGSFRLAARISDLKERGHTIRSERHRTNTGAIVARYVLVEQPTQLGLTL